ncbi:MAG: transporter [Pyrinomonadaceae bacterium]
MPARRILYSFFALLFVVNIAVAQDDDDSHHHGSLHFSHPLIVESPSPDTKIRFDYFYERSGESGEKTGEHTARVEYEYAFRRSFSIEINAPYTFRRPEAEPHENHPGNVEVSLKFASFAFDEQKLLPVYGVSFHLPTGDAGKGIGSGHVLGVEPYVGLGYQRKKIELIAFTSLGLAANRRAGDEDGAEFGYEGSVLYKLSRRFQAVLELDGSRALTGIRSGENVVNVSPGIKILPPNEHWQIGVGAGFPVTSDQEFKARAVVSVFYHFD